MDADDLENLLGLGEKSRRHEHESEIDLRRLQLRADAFGPLLQAGFIEVAAPVCRYRKIALHAANLASAHAGCKPGFSQETSSRRSRGSSHNRLASPWKIRMLRLM